MGKDWWKTLIIVIASLVIYDLVIRKMITKASIVEVIEE